MRQETINFLNRLKNVGHIKKGERVTVEELPEFEEQGGPVWVRVYFDGFHVLYPPAIIRMTENELIDRYGPFDVAKEGKK